MLALEKAAVLCERIRFCRRSLPAQDGFILHSGTGDDYGSGFLGIAENAISCKGIYSILISSTRHMIRTWIKKK